MQKKETIWRHILYETLEKPLRYAEEKYKKRHFASLKECEDMDTSLRSVSGVRFTQKDIARHFHISTSTVFNALKAPRKLGAIEATGRFFRITDAEKLLLLWATQRNLEKDIFYSTYVDAPVREIEGGMPPNVIFGAFSAYRLKYNEAVADYDRIYVYSDDLSEIKKRFPPSSKKQIPNLYVLKADSYLHDYGGDTTPDVQTFADLWNIPMWYARDYLEALKKKLNF